MSDESLPHDDALSELPELPEYAERVLDVTELIPPGRVMSYGDIAEWLEGEERPADRAGTESTESTEGGAASSGGGSGRRVGPRQVGRAMALYGGAVPWWRVVRSDGTLLPGHEQEALGHYRAEGTPLRESARADSRSGTHMPRVDMRRARWDGEERAEAHT